MTKKKDPVTAARAKYYAAVMERRSKIRTQRCVYNNLYGVVLRRDAVKEFIADLASCGAPWLAFVGRPCPDRTYILTTVPFYTQCTCDGCIHGKSHVAAHRDAGRRYLALLRDALARLDSDPDFVRVKASRNWPLEELVEPVAAANARAAAARAAIPTTVATPTPTEQLLCHP